MILFKDRRTGAEIMLKGIALTPGRLSQRNLGLDADAPGSAQIGDLHKLIGYQEPLEKRAKVRGRALWNDRVPHDLRQKIIDHRRQADQIPDGARGGVKFHKGRSDLATDIIARVDLPSKLQRRLLRLVLDSPVGGDR